MENIDIEINNNTVYEELVDKIVKKTNKKLEELKNNNQLFSISIYEKINNNNDNNIMLNEHQIFMECELEDILIYCNLENEDKPLFEIQYIFNILEIIKNGLFAELKEGEKYYFVNFYEELNEDIDLINGLFRTDFPIDISKENDNNFKNYFINYDYIPNKIINNNSDDDIEQNSKKLLELMEENNKNYDFYQKLKNKIKYLDIYILFDDYLNYFSLLKDDNFFMYHFFNHLNESLNSIFNIDIHILHNYSNKLNKIDFKENDIIEGENINMRINEFKEFVIIHKDNVILMNYIHENIIKCLN